jgi:Mg2+ and Co2+ transporter CorA
METLEFDHSVFTQGSQFNREADKALAIRFYMEAVPNQEKSTEAGRLICDDVPFIEIRVKGDRNNIQMRPVRQDDKQRFRDAWRAFESDQAAPVTGTPLKEWPAISKSMLMELNYLGFVTVEDLANASDGVCSKMAGLQMFKQKAIAFLELSKSTAPIEKMMGQIGDLSNLVNTLQRQLAEQADLTKQLQAQNEALKAQATPAPSATAAKKG